MWTAHEVSSQVEGRVVMGEEALEDLGCFCTKFWFPVVGKMNSG